jgi:hypothetical protein
VKSVDEQKILHQVSKGLYIGGEWRVASGNGTIEVEDPATGKVLTTVADATVEDGHAALDAAVAAQAEWARTAPRSRAEKLRAAFELLTSRAEEFAPPSCPADGVLGRMRAPVCKRFVDSFAVRFKSQRAPAWTLSQVRGPLLAPPVGLEPTTLRLTAECSAN